MIRYAPKRLYAALLLLILLAAYAGQKVHIYNEDHAHFSAHCGDLVPDNGAHTIIVDRCIIDDFYFFPYLDIAPTVHSFYARMLAVLLPERPFDFERDILERMRQTQATGKKHFIIIVSEGVISAQDLANQIQAATGVDSRATVLGHIQRGGPPTVRDRVNASLMGYHAIDLLDRGIYNRVVAVSGGKIVDYDVNVALTMHKTIDDSEIEVANSISI